MKIIILAGGKGTRLGYETKIRPKPLIQIGSKPIICHIMDIYKIQGFNDFIIAGGYKFNYVKKFFKKISKYKSKVVNTGKNTLTGSRLRKLKKNLDGDEVFMLTYGDGLSNVNLKKLIRFHKKEKKIATMTIIRPPARWGEVKLAGNIVTKFEEKKKDNNLWVNGGFFVFNKKIFEYIKKKENCVLESDVLEVLSKKKQLAAFKHKGFWQCMDTGRDKIFLQKMIKAKKNPWLNYDK